MSKILVVDDHPKIRENIVTYFSMHHIRVDEARTGEEALEKAPHGEYDVIILDVNMPMMGGKEFLEKYRSAGYMTPVIALTSNSLLADKESLYEAGVDDYLTKPFELKELFLRVQAICRRKEQTLSEIIEIGEVEIDTVHMQVKKSGTIVELSAKEIGILNYLACNLGIPKNKTDIILHVWGESEERLNLDSITLEVHISNIRKKISPDIITTLRGIGYVIEAR